MSRQGGKKYTTRAGINYWSPPDSRRLSSHQSLHTSSNLFTLLTSSSSLYTSSHFSHTTFSYIFASLSHIFTTFSHLFRISLHISSHLSLISSDLFTHTRTSRISAIFNHILAIYMPSICHLPHNLPGGSAPEPFRGDGSAGRRSRTLQPPRGAAWESWSSYARASAET